jgi:hypothetical protein
MFGRPFAEGLDRRGQASSGTNVDPKQRRGRVPERNVYQPSCEQIVFDPELVDEDERATAQRDLAHEFE